MDVYIIMKLTNTDLVDQVFDILTEYNFKWGDDTKPKRHMKEYLFWFDFGQDKWVIRDNHHLIINLKTKNLTYSELYHKNSRPWWLPSNSKVLRLDELQTLDILKGSPILLNKEDEL